MNILMRYLLRQNLFLLLVVLAMGTGLYLLTDLFERLDNFLQSNISANDILLYFAVKIPNIISVILPAVFLITMVVQINILNRGKEMVALNAGGISPSVLVRFVLIYALAWALVQFFFAQVLGVEGERQAARIWQEDVRGNVLAESKIDGLWFTERHMIIHIGRTFPLKGQGEKIVVYALDASGVGIEEIIKAENFKVSSDHHWRLEKVQRLVPAKYTAGNIENLDLPISQDLKTFQVTAGNLVKPAQLSFFELSRTISRLEQAGSNVETLRTAWHQKLSYAASILVMGVLALYVTGKTNNIYKAILVSLLIVFFYYSANTVCSSMAQKGLLTPIYGAWSANTFFFGLVSLLLLWPGFSNIILTNRQKRPGR